MHIPHMVLSVTLKETKIIIFVLTQVLKGGTEKRKGGTEKAGGFAQGHPA